MTRDPSDGDRWDATSAQARLAAIVESSEDAIVSKTLEGIIRTWNAGAERLFGYTEAEAAGRSITLIIPPERHDEERQILSRIARGERVEHFETVRVAKDGRLLDISLTVSPVYGPDGTVIGASKIARDITDRKRVEAALREADRKKDEYIALLAHELRNPLAPLRNGLEVVRLSGDDPEAIRGARAMMERQLDHMVRLIDDLLDVSRINQNKMSLACARVRLADVLTSAVETARPAIDAARHTFTVTMPPEPIELDADLVRLSQVFANLLSNSAKYTEAGGRIWLEAEPRDGEVVVTVRDTGIGISAAALPSIFDMFSQGDRTVGGAAGGLGLGLALVDALVKMHGGTVAAASEGAGKGSTFTVTLPLAPSGSTEEQAEPERAVEPADGDRILVVDDNRDGADSLQALLEAVGHDVRTAYGGAEALEVAEWFRPRTILMDIGMPELDGYEVTRRIRARPWSSEVVIVALTGWGQAEDRRRSQEAGCDGHLVKPVSLAALQAMLADLGR